MAAAPPHDAATGVRSPPAFAQPLALSVALALSSTRSSSRSAPARCCARRGLRSGGGRAAQPPTLARRPPQDKPCIHLSQMTALCEAVAALHDAGHRVVLVSSGAVGAGCQRLGLETKPTDLVQKQALAAVGQAFLSARRPAGGAGRGHKLAARSLALSHTRTPPAPPSALLRRLLLHAGQALRAGAADAGEPVKQEPMCAKQAAAVPPLTPLSLPQT